MRSTKLAVTMICHEVMTSFARFLDTPMRIRHLLVLVELDAERRAAVGSAEAMTRHPPGY